MNRREQDQKSIRASIATFAQRAKDASDPALSCSYAVLCVRYARRLDGAKPERDLLSDANRRFVKAITR